MHATRASGARTALALGAALFLGGALTYAALAWAARPSEVEVGFLQDMIVHHENAVTASVLVDGDDVPGDVRHFAEEVVLFQQYEIGLMEAMLGQWGEPRGTGDVAMDWMGHAVAPAEMPGMASDEEIARIQAATGDDLGARWLAVMSRHHLAGVEMAEAALDRGVDGDVADLATRFVRNQRQEILEYSAARERLGLPVPDGYTDPPTLDDGHAGHEG